MKNAFYLPGLLFLSFMLFSCNETTDDLQYGIDPAVDKSLLCESLRMLGNNKDGEMPVGTGIGGPIIVGLPSTIEVSAGVRVIIPYTVNDPDNICKVYLKVEGADNYWETPLLKETVSGKPYFDLLIPIFVMNGDFDFAFSIEDCNGNISGQYSTRTIVSPLATCGVTIEGAYGITIRLFDMGDKAGTVSFIYDMYSIPDRLDLRYDGSWVKSTGILFDDSKLLPDCNTNDGFVSGNGILSFDGYDPKRSRFVEVYISGCDVDTRWEVTPICP